MGPIDDMTRILITPLIERAALTQVLNEVRIALCLAFGLSLLMLPLISRPKQVRAISLAIGETW